MFLPDDLTMKYVNSLTTDPSDINVKVVAIAVKKQLDESLLIGMAVEPVHPGITERLHRAI